MNTQFKVKTNKGQEFNVRLCPISISNQYKKLGTEGGWDKRAEIEINGIWYKCDASQAKQNGNTVKTISISKYNKEIHEVLNIPEPARKNDIHIMASEDWHPIYLNMLQEAEKQFKIDANEAKYTKITFTYHTSYKYMCFKWDSELASDYIKYNDNILALQESLKYIDPKELDSYRTGEDYGDYSIEYYFEVPFLDLEKIKTFALPGLEKAAIDKEKSIENKRKNDEKKANIDNGCIYFICESAPHDEDLSKVILNRPAPNSGSFIIEHRLSPELFSRIKKFGRHYDKEFLEECDMFYSSPGWRFSKDAIEELLKTNRIFVDNIEISK